jgi:hypothetical protein
VASAPAARSGAERAAAAGRGLALRKHAECTSPLERRVSSSQFHASINYHNRLGTLRRPTRAGEPPSRRQTRNAPPTEWVGGDLGPARRRQFVADSRPSAGRLAWGAPRTSGGRPAELHTPKAARINRGPSQSQSKSRAARGPFEAPVRLALLSRHIRACAGLAISAPFVSPLSVADQPSGRWQCVVDHRARGRHICAPPDGRCIARAPHSPPARRAATQTSAR